MSNRGDYPLAPDLTVYARFLTTKSSKRGDIREEVIELVSRSSLFHTDDLIRLLKVGYKQLPRSEKGEFMRRVLFELKKSEHP